MKFVVNGIEGEINVSVERGWDFSAEWVGPDSAGFSIEADKSDDHAVYHKRSTKVGAGWPYCQPKEVPEELRALFLLLLPAGFKPPKDYLTPEENT